MIKYIKTICIALALTLLLGMCPVNVSAVATSAESFVLLNADTLEIIASGNADKRLPMASTTKIMTSLILAEQNTPEKAVVTTAEMVTVEGSSMGLLVGDTVTYRDLLAGMLLASGNDAANTAAISVAGSTAAFAELMNKRAFEIGMNNTHFVTPSGLDDDEHYSTAYDMALLAAEAMKNDDVRAVAGCKSMNVCYGNPPYIRRLTNHNKLLEKYEYCIGLKTGFTKKSGRCLVSSAEKNGCRVIAVTLNDPDDWDDHINLLEYGLSVLKSEDRTYALPDDTVAVAGGDVGRVRVTSNSFLCSIEESKRTEIKADSYMIPFIYAPVAPGRIVGYIEYSIGGKIIRREKIYTVGDADYVISNEGKYDKFTDGFMKIFSCFL